MQVGKEPCPSCPPPADPTPPRFSPASWAQTLLPWYSHAWEMLHQAGHSGRDGSYIRNESQCPRGRQSSTTGLSLYM